MFTFEITFVVRSKFLLALHKYVHIILFSSSVLHIYAAIHGDALVWYILCEVVPSDGDYLVYH